MPKALRLKVVFKGGPKYSGRPQLKWSVPFDLNRTAGILSLLELSLISRTVKKYNCTETNRIVADNSHLLNLKFLYAIGLVS